MYEAAEAKGRAFLAKIFDEMKLDVVIDVKAPKTVLDYMRKANIWA